jgi:folate-binding protein YgfZ
MFFRFLTHKVEDVSDDYRILSVQGPASQKVMKEVCFDPVPALGDDDWLETNVAGHHVLVARSDRTGQSGFDIFVPSGGLRDVWEFVLLKGEFHSIKPYGLEALERLRIEAGIPEYGRDIDETNMMLETGLLDAVSYSKGCYTGQEAVAMATYRGHVSKKLSGLRLATENLPSPGDKITRDGKEIGHITSSVRSIATGQAVALGYLKYGFFEPGSKVKVQIEGNDFEAVVNELPFNREVESLK